MSVILNESYIKNFVFESDFVESEHLVCAAHKVLHDKSGAGNDFLGWLDLPRTVDLNEIEKIEQAADKIKHNSQVLVVIGIGGSYLGARAVIEALQSQLHNFLNDNVPQVFFVGNDISTSHLKGLLSICSKKDFSVNVISKSGTTLEPSVAFRFFKNLLEQKYGVDGARERIFCTTDKSKGKLKELADSLGYCQFVVPDDVGGRFSVLTPVGLLPIAAAGLDLRALLSGAKKACDSFYEFDLKNNYCYRYALLRNILHAKGKLIEMLVSFEPELSVFNEWFKQLFGESEGKNHKGIFPASAIFSTDLHSLGQLIQDGPRVLFETFIKVKQPGSSLKIDFDESNFDGLNYLAGKEVDFVNKMALEGTLRAHVSGGVPCLVLEIEKLDEFNLGYLIYFFEKACAVSGYLLGVNPFDQPGVENYKRNMFELLKG